jgi:hypothetical protein
MRGARGMAELRWQLRFLVEAGAGAEVAADGEAAVTSSTAAAARVE